MHQPVRGRAHDSRHTHLFASAALSVNGFGLDLHRALVAEKPAENFLTSPYSIEFALALAARGADGDTLAELSRVLHAPASDTALLESLASLSLDLAVAARRSSERVRQSSGYGGPATPLRLDFANNLFAQKDYGFRQDYLDYASRLFAPVEILDFRKSPEAARGTINSWVSGKTSGLITDLIPANGLDTNTRLVIANALYFKASWANEFHPVGEEDFSLADGGTAKAQTIRKTGHLPAAKRDGHTAVSIPYVGDELSFLILLPNDPSGLPALEAKLTPRMLAEAALLPAVKTKLTMPKINLRPPTLDLGQTLRKLGLKTAFDQPQGSANFSRLAERKPNGYLFISNVFHKTYLVLDEKGTEAAAATAVGIARPTAIPPPEEPLVINVDRPFLFAIQHRKSGACLFLGRVTDPR